MQVVVVIMDTEILMKSCENTSDCCQTVFRYGELYVKLGLHCVYKVSDRSLHFQRRSVEVVICEAVIPTLKTYFVSFEFLDKVFQLKKGFFLLDKLL